jgi:hypothetical protein
MDMAMKNGVPIIDLTMVEAPGYRKVLFHWAVTQIFLEYAGFRSSSANIRHHGPCAEEPSIRLLILILY